MLKKMLRNNLYLFLTVLATLAAWYGRGYFVDEKPSPERVAFYSSNNVVVPDESNLAVAISGLAAPTNSDVIKFGRTVIDASSKLGAIGLNVAELSYVHKFVDFDSADLISCTQKGAIEIQVTQCVTVKTVDKIFEKNQLLLRRYFELYEISGWYGQPIVNGNMLLGINRLIALKSKALILQHKPDEAYRLLHDNQMFISRFLASKSVAILRAIYLEIDYTNLKAIDYLFYSNPELLELYGPSLEKLLKPQTIARYSLDDMIRAEYDAINSQMQKKPLLHKNIHAEYIRNEAYLSSMKFIKKASVPGSWLSQSQEKLTMQESALPAEFRFEKLLPHGGESRAILFVLNDRLGKMFYLIKSMYSHNALINLLNLRAKIVQHQVSDGDVAAFLKSAGKEYDCPFTRKPMVVDKVKSTMYCADPKQGRRVAEVKF